MQSSKLANGHLLQLNQRMLNRMRQYGYLPVDLPIIENADLFLIKAGDQIVNRLFTFEHDGRQLALRPEFTAAAAYHYAGINGGNQPVSRWQFSGFVFEDDPNNPSKNHQRWSIGAELIGMQSGIADSEIVGIAAQGLIHENIYDWRLILGHVGLLRQVLANFSLDSRTERFLLTHLQLLKNPDLGKTFLLEQLDKTLSIEYGTNRFNIEGNEIGLLSEDNTQQILDLILDATQRGVTMGGRTRDDIARRLLQKRKHTVERSQIVKAIDFLVEWCQISAFPQEAFKSIANLLSSEDTKSRAILSEWESIVEALKFYEIPMRNINIQPDLARSWDYYTGMLFELRTSNDIQLGGGGRYDELSKLLGSKRNVPAVGFAYYVDELMTLINESLVSQQADLIVYVTSISSNVGISWAKQMRQNGFIAQIFPETNPPEFSSIALYAQSNGTVRFNDKYYQMEEMTVLINDLKQGVS